MTETETFKRTVRECRDTQWMTDCYFDMAGQEVPRWDRKCFAIVRGELIKRGALPAQGATQ